MRRTIIALAIGTAVFGGIYGLASSLNVSAKSLGAGLRLCHLGSKFQEVLQITKLMTVFDVYNTEAEAVASFSKSAGA